MGDFFLTLQNRNDVLFGFGLVCWGLSFIFLVLTRLSSLEILNVSVWYKPFKFASSIAMYSWTMAWYCTYLGDSFNQRLFGWVVVVLLGFELFYISIQAGRGQLSHFNLSTPLYATLYYAMALAATFITLYTAYVGLLFCVCGFPQLPEYYVLAIRCGICLFVIFSLEGFVMGSRLTHTIGGPDGGPGLPILNWSTRFGDPRIAHFIGMHALQILPLLSYYWLRNTTLVLLAALLYLILSVFTLWQALNGKSLFYPQK